MNCPKCGGKLIIINDVDTLDKVGLACADGYKPFGYIEEDTCRDLYLLRNMPEVTFAIQGTINSLPQSLLGPPD